MFYISENVRKNTLWKLDFLISQSAVMPHGGIVVVLWMYRYNIGPFSKIWFVVKFLLKYCVNGTSTQKRGQHQSRYSNTNNFACVRDWIKFQIQCWKIKGWLSHLKSLKRHRDGINLISCASSRNPGQLGRDDTSQVNLRKGSLCVWNCEYGSETEWRSGSSILHADDWYTDVCTWRTGSVVSKAQHWFYLIYFFGILNILQNKLIRLHLNWQKSILLIV